MALTTPAIDCFAYVGQLPIPGNSGRLWRGGQPDENGFRTLLSLDVACVVKLNKDGKENPLDFEQQQLSTGAVWQAPDPKTCPVPIWAMWGVNTVTRNLAGGQNVFVHCTRGRNRTGLVIAAWRVVSCGWSIKASIDECDSLGGSSIFAFQSAADPSKDWLEDVLSQLPVSSPNAQSSVSNYAVDGDDPTPADTP